MDTDESSSSSSSESEYSLSLSNNESPSILEDGEYGKELLDSRVVEIVQQLAACCHCQRGCFEKEEDPSQWYNWVKRSRGLSKRDRKERAALLLSISIPAPKRNRYSAVYRLPFLDIVYRDFFLVYWGMSKY